MLASVNGAALLGIDSYSVEVEVDIASGLPAVEIVGLPDPAVRESRVRVKSAIRSSCFEFPNARIHVNLAPAHLKKEGPSFDLPIALAILQASGQLNCTLPSNFISVGELALDGSIRKVAGAISIAMGAKERGAPFLIVPEEDSSEAALVEGLDVYGISSLREAALFLEGSISISLARSRFDVEKLLGENHLPDLADVRGQEPAKRALEIAAAGGHNLMMVGPPGSGKTMLARRLPGILPPLLLEEALEVTRIYSSAGLLASGSPIVTRRPFRAPHYSATPAGLIGGGTPIPKPGEASLAHNGVLYLDEIALYPRNSLESLRGPLEDHFITLVRANSSISYPARFTLVASMNPCPCGYLGDSLRECKCSVGEIKRYLARISGPLMDRIDLQVRVPRLTGRQMHSRSRGESSRVVRERTIAAQRRQKERLSTGSFCLNADMDQRMLAEFASLTPEAKRFMELAVEKFGLTARSHDKIVKVARTIADLEEKDVLDVRHLAEAVQYRFLDRSII
ncbi:MAG: YifB family Mg chelatase-like AAA ATPase [Actinomycetota bacterium]|nr:YifB family Mg chelatase-like AAA ATPase [Actinomycetota bacterium]